MYVLVHCVSGISKSAGIVIAFIMKDRRLALEDAFNEVKSMRKIVTLRIFRLHHISIYLIN